MWPRGRVRVCLHETSSPMRSCHEVCRECFDHNLKTANRVLLPAVSQEASEFVDEKTRKRSSGPQAEERAGRIQGLQEPEEDTTLIRYMESQVVQIFVVNHSYHWNILEIQSEPRSANVRVWDSTKTWKGLGNGLRNEM